MPKSEAQAALAAADHGRRRRPRRSPRRLPSPSAPRSLRRRSARGARRRSRRRARRPTARRSRRARSRTRPRPRPPSSAPRRSSRTTRRGEKGISHAATSTHQVPQAAKGPQHGHCDARQQGLLRRVRPEGDHARPPDRAPDRGGAPRDVAPHQARRAHLDPHVPGQADLAQARGSAHGQRQGQSRSISSAKSSRARCCTRWTAWTRRWRRRRSRWPRPSCRSGPCPCTECWGRRNPP